MNVDIELFRVINSWVGQVPWIDWIMRGLVNDFAVPTAVSLAAVWLWFAGNSAEERAPNQRAVMLIALAVLFSNALVKDFSYIYFRPRPFATETVNLLFYRPSVSSFPSVPIMVAFCFAAGAWAVNRKMGLALALLGGLYGFSRVYAGVHYPSDVVGGAALGAGTVYLISRLSFVFNPLADAVIGLTRRMGFS